MAPACSQATAARSSSILLLLLAAAWQCAGYIEASQSPPGGLDPSNTPQFILFTHDDAIMASTKDTIREVTDGRSFSGCPATATMFVTTQIGNDCDYTMELYNAGFELADHTRTHASVKDVGPSELDDEILGSRSDLVSCGVPEADVVGFRAPFLQSDSAVRSLLHSNGFQYDSSLIEEGTGASLSGGMSARTWPFQMDGGVPINCGWFSDTQECSTSESLPGMYEVPVWQLIDSDVPYSMDYAGDGEVDVYSLLLNTFEAAYNGNRAPLPLFIHTPWLEENKGDVERFLDTVSDSTTYPNTYMVTMRQLLGWMQNPVPADQLTPEALGCGTPGGGPGTGSQPAAASNGNVSAAAQSPPQDVTAQPREVAASAVSEVPEPTGTGSTGDRTVADAFASLGFNINNRRMLK